MSRITGSDVYSMMEAYQGVYNPDALQEKEEISEEQIWEEVEAWVTSLVEEGNDLSDYTWEEMYEAYLSEGGPGPRAGTTPTTPSRPYMGPLSAGGGRAAIDKLTAKGVDPRKANAMVVAQGEKNLRAKPSPTPAAKPAPTAAAKPAAAPAARPAATAKPSPTPAAKPASTAAAKPAATAKPAPAAAPKPATPAAQPKIKQDVADIKSMQAASQARQASSAPAAAKPTPTPAATGSKKPGSVYSSFDMFDVVKGHLIGEGYADTEEAAIAIMANMSEDWKASIIAEEQLDEISLKTKMSAFKKRATHDFESDSDDDKYTKSGENKTDKIKANIVNKHGKKAGEHAERAAHAGIFGRKSFSMPKKP
jgi:hypothetical protein